MSTEGVPGAVEASDNESPRKLPIRWLGMLVERPDLAAMLFTTSIPLSVSSTSYSPLSLRDRDRVKQSWEPFFESKYSRHSESGLKSTHGGPRCWHFLAMFSAAFNANGMSICPPWPLISIGQFLYHDTVTSFFVSVFEVCCTPDTFKRRADLICSRKYFLASRPRILLYSAISSFVAFRLKSCKSFSDCVIWGITCKDAV